MAHLLVDQLRFARAELLRCLDGVSEKDGVRRVGPMNCISWIVGHLAHQENVYWVLHGQGELLFPGLHKRVGWGYPAGTPPLAEMWDVWRTITAAADVFLETLTPELLQTHLAWKGRPLEENAGTLLLRNTLHYWFHLGEAHAIRQQLGHTDLPQFVGNMAGATYRPEE